MASFFRRKASVKVCQLDVKKTLRPCLIRWLTGLILDQAAETGAPDNVASNRRRSDMSVVVYIVLTVAIFALLGLVQKLVEGL